MQTDALRLQFIPVHNVGTVARFRVTMRGGWLHDTEAKLFDGGYRLTGRPATARLISDWVMAYLVEGRGGFQETKTASARAEAQWAGVDKLASIDRHVIIGEFVPGFRQFLAQLRNSCR